VIGADFVAFSKKLPDRVMEHLRLLDGDHGGFPIDRLKHPVHTATLAAKAGRDDEYVASASLHAIGDTLGSYNHADLAAAIVKPFVSQENHWIVEQHGIFQG
jgi:predicted HD phosphohydrolase